MNHRGSCHCGAVRFICQVDLSAGTSRCNCSICLKTRFWKAIVPLPDFRLEQGADDLTEYRFGSGGIVHHFCRRCGVKVFGRGDVEPVGAFYAVSVVCLDDLNETALAAIPVSFEDGRRDAWEREPAETGQL